MSRASSRALVQLALACGFLFSSSCSLDRRGRFVDADTGPAPDAGVDSATDGSSGCPPGRVDANGDPRDGCEYVCTPSASREEICDGLDNDCDPTTLDGVGESTLGDACDGDDSDLCQEGSVVCTDGALICDDTTGDARELCNSVDDDCDPSTPDGADEVGVGCDGDDPDSCAGGLTVCVDGAIQCDDPGGAGPEICDGIDNDCDPSTPDGSADPMLGDACDGPDADLCAEGTLACVSGSMSCDDLTGDIADVCDGADNDCNPATPDGSADPMLGATCDGPDADLCAEGTLSCVSGSMSCDDATGDNLEICNGLDDDCRPGTADGSADPMLGVTCDGPDADLCKEGAFVCRGGSMSCDDATGDNLDVCNGLDDDCRPGTADGSADPMLGAACDGPDADLCKEGTLSCVSASLSCNDTTGDNLDVCNGADDDCRPGTADGSADPMLGVACDGADADLCKEGGFVCSGGGLSCDDVTGSNLELCDGVDNDCRPSTPDGADDTLVGLACDGPDSDACKEGVSICASGAVACNDTTGDTLDVCNGLDDDCNSITPDGSDEIWYGTACDGPDADFCMEGSFGCTSSMQVCSDATGDSVEVCNGVDDDCDGSIDEGDVCSGCTTRQYAGHGYLFCGSNTWPNAESACTGFGSYRLAKITSSGEQSFVAGVIGTTTHWIGLNDRGTEGTFLWSDGSAQGPYSSWQSGQPNDWGGLGQDCIVVDGGSGGNWNDRNCDVNSFRFICESL
ncbi:MAG: C-type lectin domain-containing protein [Deltaproteobacteria bacterium]|nr:C-type lectin domain-containing protein [Deltaproteobacteria bacterium]